MTRLTVLYNLSAGTDEAEFLNWRLTDHQAENASMPRLKHTDFGRVEGVWPSDQEVPYRFMTILEWESRADFEAAFYAPDEQTALQKNLARMKNPLFLISEILLEATFEDGGE